MGLRNDHTIDDKRQEHVENHNLLEPVILALMQGTVPVRKRWYGVGPPAVVVGSSPGDEYVDSLTGNLYVLE